MSNVTKLAALSLILATAPADSAKNKTAAQDQTKYCIQIEAATGSRINKVECRTRAEWAQVGVDVDEISKK